jgi:hypothetical protein
VSRSIDVGKDEPSREGKMPGEFYLYFSDNTPQKLDGAI